MYACPKAAKSIIGHGIKWGSEKPAAHTQQKLAQIKTKKTKK